MAARGSLSHYFFLSMVAMAIIPTVVLGYLWLSEQQRLFEAHNSFWVARAEALYEQQLRREARRMVDEIELRQAGFDAAAEQSLQRQFSQVLPVIEEMAQRGASRSEQLQRLRELINVRRLNGPHDHLLLYDADGTPLVDYPGAPPFTPPADSIARRDVSYAPERAGAPSTSVRQKGLFIDALDVWLVAAFVLDERRDGLQSELLQRFMIAAATDELSVVRIYDRNRQLLAEYIPEVLYAELAPEAPPVEQLLADALDTDPSEQPIRLPPLPQVTGPPLQIIAFAHQEPVWGWYVTTSLRQDLLKAELAAQAAQFGADRARQIAIVGVIVALLLVAAALAAGWLAARARRSLDRFTNFFASADGQQRLEERSLAFREFRAIAADANQMVAQRNAAEQALRRAEARVQMALELGGLYMWEYHIIERRLVLSPELASQFALPVELDEDACMRTVHPDDLDAVLRMLRNPDFELLRSAGLEFRSRDVAGRWRWFSYRGGVAEWDAQGRPLLALGTATEVTVRKRMEAELIAARVAAEDANHAKSQFLSSVSHELRTPLNGVLGYTQILLREGMQSDEQRRQLQAIESCGQHLLTLINDVLDLARIESGVLEVQPVRSNLFALLQSVSDIVRERCDAKALAFHLDVDPHVPIEIEIDETKLRQVLINLLSNAVKFTDHGFVRLTVKPSGARSLYFEVADTGVGVDAEQQRRLFQPFVQLGDGAGGSGLGLAISQRLCEALGSTLQVASEPGQGSRFFFLLAVTLPPVDAAPATVQPLVPQTVLAPAEPLRIVVADDNVVNRQVLAGMLRSSSLEILEAENGAEAVALVREGGVALVLMDVRMPVMDGFEATRQIKGTPATASTAVIAVTASVLPGVIAEMQEAGCDDFIGKPVRSAELLEKIGNLLQIKLVAPRLAAASRWQAAAAALPVSCRERLVRAVTMGDLEGVRRGISELRKHGTCAELIEYLGRLLDDFDLEALRHLVAPAEAEN